ncbi:MAG: sulfatase [bacterium]
MKIILIAIDTLRADHLSCYGYHRPTSPNIDGAAKSGILFENAIAANIPTQPAYTSIYTGVHGATHGFVAHGGDASLDRGFPLLAEVLRERGITTAAVDNLASHKPWFARGYDYYINPRAFYQHITAGEMNSYVIPWIEQNYCKDFFLFIHYWDPHTPYLPPKEYIDRFYNGEKNDPNNRSFEAVKRQPVYPFFKKWHYDLLGEFTDIEYVASLYDAEIAYVDDKVGEVFGVLEDRGISSETAVFITSDHGESLTEHNLYFDHPGLYEPTVHVPLIVRWSERFPEARRIGALIQHIDIPVTILDMVGADVPETMQGRSLLPLMRGESDGGYEAIYLTECTWQAKWGVRTPEWKFIKTIDPGLHGVDGYELYNLKEDPLELRNLASERADVLDYLELKLVRWMDKVLRNRPDPVRVSASRGLPAKAWVERVLQEQHTTWDEWVKRQRYI